MALFSLSTLQTTIDEITSMTMRRSMEDMAWSLDVSVRQPRDKYPLSVWETCAFAVQDQLVFTGFIIRRDISFNASGSHTYQVGCQSTTTNLVSCSPKSKVWRGKSLKQIAEELTAPFSLSVTIDSSAAADAGRAFSYIATEGGEKFYDILSRMASYRGLLCTTDIRGDVVFTRTAGITAPGQIGTGQSRVLQTDFSEDGTDLYSEYNGESQIPSADGLDAGQINVKATVTNDFLPVFRPITILPDGAMNRSELRKKLEWERAMRTGRSVTLGYTLNTFEAGPGVLWEPNQLVEVSDERYGVFATMLVRSVNFSFDESGPRTRLDLVDQFTYDPTKAPIPKDPDSVKGLG